MRPVNLTLPLSSFEDLHKLAGGRGKFCKVSKWALQGLLMDHAKALATLADMNIPVEDSYADCRSVRQARQNGT